MEGVQHILDQIATDYAADSGDERRLREALQTLVAQAERAALEAALATMADVYHGDACRAAMAEQARRVVLRNLAGARAAAKE